MGRRCGGRAPSALLADTSLRVLRAGESLAVHAVVVDARDQGARRFYEHFGFVGLPRSERRMVYPLAAIERMIRG